MDSSGKKVSVGTGQTPVKKLQPMLRDMIIAGVAKPSFIVSHKISIEEAPDAYREFAKRSEGFTKVTIQFENKFLISFFKFLFQIYPFKFNFLNLIF